MISVLKVNDIQNDESIELSVFEIVIILKHLQNAMHILNEDEDSAEIVTFCECGSPLHISKIRGTIDTIDCDYVCRSCGNRYNEYRLRYPSEHTSYNYNIDGVFTKI